MSNNNSYFGAIADGVKFADDWEQAKRLKQEHLIKMQEAGYTVGPDGNLTMQEGGKAHNQQLQQSIYNANLQPQARIAQNNQALINTKLDGLDPRIQQYLSEMEAQNKILLDRVAEIEGKAEGDRHINQVNSFVNSLYDFSKSGNIKNLNEGIYRSPIVKEQLSNLGIVAFRSYDPVKDKAMTDEAGIQVNPKHASNVYAVTIQDDGTEGLVTVDGLLDSLKIGDHLKPDQREKLRKRIELSAPVNANADKEKKQAVDDYNKKVNSKENQAEYKAIQKENDALTKEQSKYNTEAGQALYDLGLGGSNRRKEVEDANYKAEQLKIQQRQVAVQEAKQKEAENTQTKATLSQASSHINNIAHKVVVDSVAKSTGKLPDYVNFKDKQPPIFYFQSLDTDDAQKTVIEAVKNAGFVKEDYLKGMTKEDREKLSSLPDDYDKIDRLVTSIKSTEDKYLSGFQAEASSKILKWVGLGNDKSKEAAKVRAQLQSEINDIRHKLFGGALTEHEMAAFARELSEAEATNSAANIRAVWENYLEKARGRLNNFFVDNSAAILTTENGKQVLQKIVKYRDPINLQYGHKSAAQKVSSYNSDGSPKTQGQLEKERQEAARREKEQKAISGTSDIDSGKEAESGSITVKNGDKSTTLVGYKKDEGNKPVIDFDFIVKRHGTDKSIPDSNKPYSIKQYRVNGKPVNLDIDEYYDKRLKIVSKIPPGYYADINNNLIRRVPEGKKPVESGWFRAKKMVLQDLGPNEVYDYVTGKVVKKASK